MAIYPSGVANAPRKPGYLPAFPTVRIDSDANGEHIARWDPARVLAEVAAKRAVLELHTHTEPSTTEQGEPDTLTWCANCNLPIDDCPTLLALAQPYAGHPDFDEAWRA